MRVVQARGCGLRGLRATPSLQAHKKRFTNNGWTRADAWDMDTIYRKFLDPKEHARYDKSHTLYLFLMKINWVAGLKWVVRKGMLLRALWMKNKVDLGRLSKLFPRSRHSIFNADSYLFLRM